MPEAGRCEEFLAGGCVDAAVFALRPDYRVLPLAVDGLVPRPGGQASDPLLAAEAAAGEALRGGPPDQLPHVAAWREAYPVFGAKPQRTRNSLKALLRRALSGLPRVIRATGGEAFDTVADGVAVTEHPEAGEVVWCDDAAVTCRRWNWRQARRTQLRADTTTALFILDALDPVTGEALHAAAGDLLALLARLGPDVRAARRLITAGPAPDEGD